MFTGIIQTLGVIHSNTFKKKAGSLVIKAALEALELGESIAVNGACLTLASVKNDLLTFDVSEETLIRTEFANLRASDEVHLERAMLANARFGGHIVCGHIDTKAFITKKEQAREYLVLTLGEFGEDPAPYLIPKGSIAVNGVSLTINTCTKDTCSLMLIPHTLKNTTFGKRNMGDALNIEFDYFTKILFHQTIVRTREEVHS